MMVERVRAKVLKNHTRPTTLRFLFPKKLSINDNMC